MILHNEHRIKRSHSCEGKVASEGVCRKSSEDAVLTCAEVDESCLSADNKAACTASDADCVCGTIILLKSLCCSENFAKFRVMPIQNIPESSSLI